MSQDTTTPPPAKPRAPAKARRIPLTVLPLILFLAIAAAWSLAWWIAAGRLEREVEAAVAREALAGRTYRCADRQVSGYPFRLELRCSRLDIAADGVTVQAPAITALAQIWNPRHIIAETSGAITLEGERIGPKVTLNADLTQASLILRDGPERVSIVLIEPRLAAPNDLLQARLAEMHIRRGGDAGEPASYDIVSVADGLTMTGGLLKVPVRAELQARLSRLGIPAPGAPAALLKDWQARGGMLDLVLLKLTTGEGVATATGSFALDPQGRATGNGKLALAGFEKTPGLEALMRGAFQALALFGERVTVDGKPGVAVPLRVDAGRLRIGPVQLGALPPLF